MKCIIENNGLVTVNGKPVVDEELNQIYINIDNDSEEYTVTTIITKNDISKKYEFDLLEMTCNRFLPLELTQLENPESEDILVFKKFDDDFFIVEYILCKQFEHDPMLKEFWSYYQW
jgi:hypothetical protein